MSVDVVIPFRSNNDPDRDRALLHVVAWLTRRQPDWGIRIGHVNNDGPWCKATAVTDAVAGSVADVIVVHDADVFTTGIEYAVDVVRGGGVGWAVPHNVVYRLDAAMTERAFAGEQMSTRLSPRDGLVERAYRGHPGGGIVVLARDTWARTPLDARFVGWGQEDDSWAHALRCTHGPEWRGQAPLWHLWHAPQPRQARRLGSAASTALWKLYHAARTNQAAMVGLAEGAARHASLMAVCSAAEGRTVNVGFCPDLADLVDLVDLNPAQQVVFGELLAGHQYAVAHAVILDAFEAKYDPPT